MGPDYSRPRSRKRIAPNAGFVSGLGYFTPGDAVGGKSVARTLCALRDSCSAASAIFGFLTMPPKLLETAAGSPAFAKRVYNVSMRYPAMGAVSIRVVVLAALLFFFLVPSLNAQIHGTAASVTSHGFGGSHSRAPGTPASVTSFGGFGRTGGRRPGFAPGFYSRRSRGFHGGYLPYYVYGVPYGYYDYGYDYDDLDQPPEPPPQDEYLGGPTIFDRRGPGTAQYSEARPSEAPEPAAQPASEPDQPQTVLVFKDGHQLEVQNYAIVGDTLYNLSATRNRKIALTDLDLKATVRENDDRGIDFRLPPGLQLPDTRTN